MANLRAIVNNDTPIREPNYPRTWFLYKDAHIIEIDVRHDSRNRPFVRGKGGA
jgi:hypothetical protein